MPNQHNRFECAEITNHAQTLPVFKSLCMPYQTDIQNVYSFFKISIADLKPYPQACIVIGAIKTDG